MADYVSKDMINKAMQVDLLEYAKSLGMEFETREIGRASCRERV